ncbi:hypothetical protein [Burkholderia dolosa]|uniref:hypothetical protein n=1 Tax=Burkholderia dolosa TaxID=152500 RepID=UPI001B9A7B4B|nr:hypothetical protein [Burkholderia dolosa]MBR8056619.1 hypothetical protein [Burkholderia dolosa]MBR8316371.1 hypothetical protein [Burkholderia dolosa]
MKSSVVERRRAFAAVPVALLSARAGSRILHRRVLKYGLNARLQAARVRAATSFRG